MGVGGGVVVVFVPHSAVPVNNKPTSTNGQKAAPPSTARLPLTHAVKFREGRGRETGLSLWICHCI